MAERGSRLGLELRLPLLIGALLLLTAVGIGAGAYAEGKRASLAVAKTRLTTVTQQLSQMFAQSATQLRGQATAAAHKLAPGKLPAYQGPNPDQVVAIQLRDSNGAVLTSTGKWTASLDDVALPELKAALHADSVVLGGFRMTSDSLVYPIAARVPGPAGQYLVYWRKLAGSRRAREQVSQLIGSDAALFLGSPSTDTWTNLEGKADAPVADPDKFLAAEQNVAGTPWRVVMHFPLAPVRAASGAFIRRIAVVTAIALIVGLFGTWYISRKILRALESTVKQRTAELHQALDELRDAQETLVRKEKLAMLGQLASGVGHELRNPLGVMTNAVYFLRMVLQPPQPQVAEYLDILQQQVTLSEKIVSDLLDFARLKQPQRSAVSVADITHAQIARLGATTGMQIENTVGANLPRVMVDEVQVGQIVLNLLTNAMQATDGSGRIVIRAASENGHLHYDVADNGPGIAPENIHKIFEPLFTTKARGIGLGLAVSRTLARANAGELTVTSAPGQGAVFRLTLPTAKASGEGMEAA